MYRKVDLEAINEERDIRRYYTIIIDRNLFGEFSVTTIYGRIGHKGTTRHYHFKTMKEAEAKFEEALQKRLKSESRIGVAYEVIHRICA